MTWINDSPNRGTRKLARNFPKVTCHMLKTKHDGKEEKKTKKTGRKMIMNRLKFKTRLGGESCFCVVSFVRFLSELERRPVGLLSWVLSLETFSISLVFACFEKKIIFFYCDNSLSLLCFLQYWHFHITKRKLNLSHSSLILSVINRKRVRSCVLHLCDVVNV